MCLDVPGGNGCPSGVGWRQMTKPYNGSNPDEWQYNSATARIELKGLKLGNDSGAGLYKGYVRTGTSGTPSMIEVTIKNADVGANNPACGWQAHSVFGPVGTTNIDTSKVACNATTA